MSSEPIAKMLMLLGLNNEQFEKNIEQGIRSLQRFERQSKRTGKELTTYLTAPIMGMGAITVMAFNKQEAAEVKLRAAFRVTGREIEGNMQRAKAFASELQRVTKVGDETTLKLLQFATIQGLSADQSERATRNAISMAAAFDMNEESAIRMTAALEAGDASMLRRYIPSLREAKTQAEAVAMAHTILGGAFEIAKDDAARFEGQLKQISNSLGDVGEQFGGVVAGRLMPFTSNVKAAVHWLDSLNMTTKGNIVTMLGLMAVIGPTYLAVGTMTRYVLLLNTTMAKNPAMLVVSGLVALGTALMFAERRTDSYIRKIREQISEEGRLQGTLEERQKLQVRLREIDSEIRKLENQSKNNPYARGQDVYFKIKALQDEAAAIRVVHDESIQLQNAKKKQNEDYKNELANITELLDKYKGLSGQMLQYSEAIDKIINTESALALSDYQELNRLYEKRKALEDLIKLRQFYGSLGFDAGEGQMITTRGVDAQRVTGRNMSPTHDQAEYTRRYASSVDFLGAKLTPVTAKTAEWGHQVTIAQQRMEAMHMVTTGWVDNFGTGITHVLMQTESFGDAIRNIGKLFLSSAIQKGIGLFMTGGLSGAGFFGSGGGLLGMLGFADGGKPPVGRASIVGEKGPEIFVPDQAGTIVPNYRLRPGSIMGSVGGDQHIYIHLTGGFELSGPKLLTTINKTIKLYKGA